MSKLGALYKARLRQFHFFWRFSGGFWFSQDHLFSRNSTRKPLNLIKSPIFTNTPCKSTCLYNAPSMHTVDQILRIKSCDIFGCQIRPFFRFNWISRKKHKTREMFIMFFMFLSFLYHKKRVQAQEYYIMLISVHSWG